MMLRLLSMLVFGAMQADASLNANLVALKTEEWMDAVVKLSNPTAVTNLFCENGLLVATAGLGIRTKTHSYDGWSDVKIDGKTIESYFDWFAKLPGQNITAFHHNIENVTENVWVNNAWVNWTWVGNPGLTARMTFVFRDNSPTCIFELHSSGLPESPDDKRRLRALSSQPRQLSMSKDKVAQGTQAWMNAVVQQSNPQLVADQFCGDGMLVATAGEGIRFQTYSVDGWGNLKVAGTTIKTYFDWFATLPAQNVTKYHNNIVEVSPNVWINNAWVDWVWGGNPGLTARMTFIFKATSIGICIFELHSSQLPQVEGLRRLQGV